MTPEEANARNQAMVTALEEQRNTYANEIVTLKADKRVLALVLDAAQARIAELEAEVASLKPKPVEE